MAEVAAAAVAVATAVVKLGRFVHEQAGFLDVKDDVERLIKELKWMHTFLEDAENRLDDSKLSQLWMSNVKDLAFECEAVIDKFLGEQKTLTGCLAAMPSCFTSYITNPRSAHKLKGEIKRLKTELNDISSRQDRYRLNVNDIGTSSSKNEVKKLMELRRSTPNANNECMVGQQDTTSLLMTKLTNGRSGRFIVFIVGMGGLGKTTIARKLYQKLHKQYFTWYAWICVSQVYDHRGTLLLLIKSMSNPPEHVLESLTKTESMESYLYDFLRTRKFLVVLDDLWEREAWEMLQRALPDNNNGSRIIITSRNVNVGKRSEAYVHKLRYLEEDEGWELFCKKAFPDDMVISPGIEIIGKEMVAKCLGLPLAIVTLGGLLSTKSNSVSEWKQIRDYLWKELENDSMHIKAVLSLSYMDLPDYLKQCFLYVGMFPEDFEIPISKLILLWVAEGFIKADRRTPESVAKSYFDELVGRSLFHKKGEDWIDSTFRVHDLLRDLAIDKAKDEGFSIYYDENQLKEMTDRTFHERLVAFQSEDLPSRYKNPYLRTLFISSTGSPKEFHMDDTHIDTPSNKLLRSVHLHYGLLRVIDIHHRGYMHLPSEIGELIHLRYFGFHMLVRHVPVSNLEKLWEVPDTIGNLKALQTLSITCDQDHYFFRTLTYLTLPPTMEKLQALRHLIGRFVLGDRIAKLIGLETLQGITCEEWCGIDTTNMVNLRHLSLTNIGRYNDPHPATTSLTLHHKFQTIKKLQTLSLLTSQPVVLVPISISKIFGYCPEITHFKSIGINFVNSANLHEFAINLEVLDVLYYVHIEDPMPIFERLPALRALRMVFVDPQNLVCSTNGFPQLRTLVIRLCGSGTLVVEEGGMPLLTCLKTNDSQKVKAPKRLMDLIVNTTDLV